jgi:hypothetical protein
VLVTVTTAAVASFSSGGELVNGAVRERPELGARDERPAGVALAADGLVVPGIALVLAGLDVTSVEREEAHERLERVPVGQAVDVRREVEAVFAGDRDRLPLGLPGSP